MDKLQIFLVKMLKIAKAKLHSNFIDLRLSSIEFSQSCKLYSVEKYKFYVDARYLNYWSAMKPIDDRKNLEILRYGLAV